jgi:hypothetical protein
MAPSSTSENSTNPELKQSNSFKLGKAFDYVNESGGFLIDLQQPMLKVDSISRVFNAGRLSKKDIPPNLSTLSFERNVMNDGRILICSPKHTENSSRCTIDCMTSSNLANLSKL